MNISTRFLAAVWSLQKTDGSAFLSLKAKDTGKWQDIAVPVDQQSGPIAFDPPNSDRGDIYFSPCVFAEPRRTNDLALPSRLLYADLDEVDPRTLHIRPTAAWQSSPARYQALWVLTKRLSPEIFSDLNRALTYSTGADKGGWHQSKVLRLPGTRNYKYRGRPLVKLMWFTAQRYAPQSLADDLKGSAPPSTPSRALQTPSEPLTPVPSAALKRLSPRVRRLLRVRTPVAGEDRSALLWEIENGCLAAGLTPEQTLTIAKACAYNKYKGQRRELRMLWTEIQKAKAQQKKESAEPDSHAKVNKGSRGRRSPKKPPISRADREGGAEMEPGDQPRPTRKAASSKRPAETSTPLKPVKLKRFLASPVAEPSWLVESIWGRAAQGIWAGEFKAYKSTLLLDLAVSVASGSPFLGQFDVKRQGPVIFIQEENSKSFMHDRLHRIVQAKGLGNQFSENGGNSTIQFGKDLDLWIHSMTGFRLTEPEHLTALEAWCYLNDPALVILDPLYRMAPNLNEKNSEDMAPMLTNLSRISNKNDCALVLAHHYNQPTADNKGLRSGYRISGSSVFARWYESSVFVERKGEEGDYTVKFTNEHREHAQGTPQTVTVDLDPLDPDTYGILLENDSGSNNRSRERGRQPASEQRRKEIRRYLTAIDKPRPLVKIKKDLRIKRTEHVQMLLKRVGGFAIETRTIGGKAARYAIPL